MRFTFFLIFLIFSSVSSEDTFYLSFQPDGFINQESTLSWAKAIQDIPTLANFSVCFWMKLTFERDYNQLWSYCEDQSESFICYGIAFAPPYFVLNVANTKVRIDAAEAFKTYLWNHVCYTLESDNWIFYINGQLLQESIIGNETSGIEGGGVLILGQVQNSQNSLDGDFEQEESYSGSISLFNLWDVALNKSYIEALAECSSSLDGNVASWRPDSWLLGPRRIFKLGIESHHFCAGDLALKQSIVFPDRMEKKDASQLCLSFGASLTVPKTEAENKETTELAGKFQQVCQAESQSGKTIWLGIEFDEKERIWYDSRNKTPISYSNFVAGHGRGDDNCGYLITGDTEENDSGKWGSTICSHQITRSLCAMCQFDQERVQFNLKGLCIGSKFDRHFTLQVNGTSKPFFQGKSSSVIAWNETLETWVLYHLKSKSYGVANDQGNLHGKWYPVGRHFWQLFDEDCNNHENETHILTLSRCKDEEFTCSDGTCRPLEDRCDLKPDCEDKSDEEKCHKVLIPENYDSGMPPKQGDPGSKIVKPLELHLTVEILNFEQIKTLDMSISMALRLNLTWRDRRLQFFNLREDIYLNTVGNNQRSDIWIPEIGFANAKTGPLVKDEYQSLLIRQDSLPLQTNAGNSRENYIYSGHQNSLMHLRRYFVEYQCTFNLRFFPFDHQTCLMVFKMRTATEKTVVLVPEGGFVGPFLIKTFIWFQHIFPKCF